MDSAEVWAAVFVVAMCAFYDLLRWLSKRNFGTAKKMEGPKWEQIAPLDECFEEDDW
mgnify:CR=1 FL=1